jgi:hypothetical protein
MEYYDPLKSAHLRAVTDEGSRLEMKIVTNVIHQLKRVRIPSKGPRRGFFSRKKHEELLEI